MHKPVQAIEVRIWGKTVGAVGTAHKVIRQVQDAVAAWPDFARQAGVRPLESDKIREHHYLL
jgi:hypothetical protein